MMISNAEKRNYGSVEHIDELDKYFEFSDQEDE